MIPKKIFQTFEHTEFNVEFQAILDEWKTQNPEFSYEIHTSKDRETFIKNNFPENVYKSYTRIKPGAFKADLWRYCILYAYGGFYCDVDTLCLGSLKAFINNETDFVAAIDLNPGGLGYHNVANAFIGATKGHSILKASIDSIVSHVESGKLPINIMNFAGPGCLGISINRYLSRPDEESMVDFQGKHGSVSLIKFEPKTEYVKNLDGTIILQNKNGNPFIGNLYEIECNKVKNYFDWGSFGFWDVKFSDIVKIDPFETHSNTDWRLTGPS